MLLIICYTSLQCGYMRFEIWSWDFIFKRFSELALWTLGLYKIRYMYSVIQSVNVWQYNYQQPYIQIQVYLVETTFKNNIK